MKYKLFCFIFFVIIFISLYGCGENVDFVKNSEIPSASGLFPSHSLQPVITPLTSSVPSPVPTQPVINPTPVPTVMPSCEPSPEPSPEPVNITLTLAKIRIKPVKINNEPIKSDNMYYNFAYNPDEVKIALFELLLFDSANYDTSNYISIYKSSKLNDTGFGFENEKSLILNGYSEFSVSGLSFSVLKGSNLEFSFAYKIKNFYFGVTGRTEGKAGYDSAVRSFDINTAEINNQKTVIIENLNLSTSLNTLNTAGIIFDLELIFSAI